MTDRAELQRATVAKLREQAEFLKHGPATWQLLTTAANEIERLRTINADMLATAEKLVTRLDYIHEHPAYKSVWAVSQLHVGPYNGPTYTEALAELRAAIDAWNRAIARATHESPALTENEVRYQNAALADENRKLLAALVAVDAWATELGYYAEAGTELAPVFQQVRAALKTA